MAGTFIGARRLHTTSKGGPHLGDVQTRRVWSLSSGKLLDECDVDTTPDHMLHRQLPAPDDIRVELVLKGALAMYEEKGPDVCEIYSQPRVCQEAKAHGLQPGWSLDLTTIDPKTGERWDLSKVEVQDRVRKLVRDTKPFCIVGSPPCTPFSPLQEIGRGRRDPEVMREELERGKRHIRFCIELYKIQLAGHRHFVHEHPAELAYAKDGCPQGDGGVDDEA